MAQLAATLQSMVGRPVVDRTGLTGGFDMDLQWTPLNDSGVVPNGVDAAPGPNGSPDESASIFTAVQEQLGLKLERQRDRFEVLVIDHVARPTANYDTMAKI